MKTTVIAIAMAVLLIGTAFGAGTEEEGQPSQVVELRYDTWYPPQADLDALMVIFEEENPGITVETLVTDPTDRQQRLPVQLASGEVLDVIGMGNNEVEALKGYLAPLEPLLDAHIGDWEAVFTPANIEFARGLSDQMYVLHMGTLGSDVYYYNADMFDVLGLEAPETIDDLASAVDVIEQEMPDVLPVSFRGAINGMSMFATMALWGQKEDIFGELMEGSLKFDDPEVFEAAKFWVSLFRDGYVFSREVYSLDNSTAVELFTGEKAAVFVQGSWMAGLLSTEWREANDVDFRVGAFVPAVVAGETPTMAYTPDLGLSVHRESEHQAESMELVKFMTMGPGLEAMAGSFRIFPSFTDYKPDLSVMTGVGLEGYEQISTAISNPENPLRNRDANTTQFGRVLDALALEGADDATIREELERFQDDVEAGRF